MNNKNNIDSANFMDIGTAIDITYEMSKIVYKIMTNAAEKLYPDNKEDTVCLSMNGIDYTYKDIKIAMDTMEDFITNNFGKDN